MILNSSDKPQIDYPCPWEYRIIGQDVAKLRQAVASVLGTRAYSIRPSHESSSGKYVSLSVEIVVPDEAYRLSTFESLRSHADIRMVL